ncbi:MAG: hypothetical protein DDT33_00582 [Firmicutes bacterium]|nr:hypothetical protein [Bacillota bacterium]
MTIHIKIPNRTWDGALLDQIYHSIQSAPELGFVYKTSLSDLVKENENRPSLWSAFLDSKLAGTAVVGSRAANHHLWRHGDIAVFSEFRRRRYGTLLYFTQILQAILEGRRIIEDTIVPDLSPWMVRPDCNGQGFLPAVGYQQLGIQPGRTRTFKDIELWGGDTDYLISNFFDRLPDDLKIDIYDTPKVRNGFQKNVEIFDKYSPKLADWFRSQRNEILTGDFYGIPLNVTVLADDSQIRDSGGNWVKSSKGVRQ